MALDGYGEFYLAVRSSIHIFVAAWNVLAFLPFSADLKPYQWLK